MPIILNHLGFWTNLIIGGTIGCTILGLALVLRDCYDMFMEGRDE